CDFDDAVEKVRASVELGCLTRGAKGSLLVTADETVTVEAENLGPVVDTTGAGDQYAAGVLIGLARGMSLAESGRLGSLAAAEVISHVGPRPLRPLASFLD
ncbi:MAG: PfkB family carbohydrate kinase, partial [Acidimicrobiales bacterium]